MRHLPVSGWILVLALAASSLAAGERELNARWQGAWVVTRVATESDCGSLYTNNEVRGDLVAADGRVAFADGELARVAKVNLNRRRIEVFLDLGEPVLQERRDGPFQLFDETYCRVELRLPRAGGGDVAADGLIAAVLERHATAESARGSALWNERRRADYPVDYAETLARYEAWRVEQVNRAVQARLDEAIEETARLARRIDDDPDYLTGFAAGVERGRDESTSDDCDRLLGRSVAGAVTRPPDGHPPAWDEGYEDGQRLVFFAEMARRLRGCFVGLPL